MQQDHARLRTWHVLYAKFAMKLSATVTPRWEGVVSWRSNTLTVTASLQCKANRLYSPCRCAFLYEYMYMYMNYLRRSIFLLLVAAGYLSGNQQIRNCD